MSTFNKAILITLFICLSVFAFAQTNTKFTFKGNWQLKLYSQTTKIHEITFNFDSSGTGIDSNKKPFIWGWREDQFIIRTLNQDYILSLIKIDDTTFNVQAELILASQNKAKSYNDISDFWGLEGTTGEYTGYLKKLKDN
jgi:hypothetical protein